QQQPHLLHLPTPATITESDSTPLPLSYVPPALLVDSHEQFFIAYVFSVIVQATDTPAIVIMRDCHSKLSC
ncbi:MAG: hypothetical protein JWL77_6797, partial [Chthonomonadaceae bacterium]|nr:hypothetical protein [Chthonomonadaceae bacterium]